MEQKVCYKIHSEASSTIFTCYFFFLFQLFKHCLFSPKRQIYNYETISEKSIKLEETRKEKMLNKCDKFFSGI